MAKKKRRRLRSADVRDTTKQVVDQDAHNYPYLTKFGGVKKYGKQQPEDNFDKDVHY